MDYDFEAILRAKAQGLDALNEASLGRVYQHYLKSKKTSFGILTSWREKEEDPKNVENKRNFKALRNDIRSAGLGFFRLLGHWKQVGQDEVTAEPSLFVPGISKQLITKLSRKYDQDAVVWSGPETGGNVILIARGGSEQSIGKFHPGRIAQFYSSVRGGSFTFEGFEYPPQTSMQALLAQLAAAS